jgi:hypothetical protein
MPQCLVDFECEYDGRLVRLKAGRDWVAPGHEIVRRYPGRFGLERGRRHRASQARSHVASADVVFRRGRPRFEVELSPELVERIHDEIAEVARADVETGGYLIAHRFDYITGQTGPGPRSSHHPNRFQLDRAYAGECIGHDDWLRVVGDWHSHTGDDEGVPSPTDLRGWAGGCGPSTPAYVGIIATKGELGFTTPVLHGYLTRRGAHRTVTEHVRLNY